MFPRRYFPARYFAPRYWPAGIVPLIAQELRCLTSSLDILTNSTSTVRRSSKMLSGSTNVARRSTPTIQKERCQ